MGLDLVSLQEATMTPEILKTINPFSADFGWVFIKFVKKTIATDSYIIYRL